MSTNYIAPIWRMPRNANNTPVNKLSNYSINFNGTTDYIEISDNILAGLANFSISVWYNANSLTNDRAILGAWSAGITQMLLYWDDNDDDPPTGVGWRFLMNNGTTSYDVVWGRATTTNEWNHIVVTYDGSTLSFYHNNGTPETDVATGSVRTPSTTPLPAWRIGVDTSSTRYWDGKLSQFCLFDYALDTNQVEYLYDLNNPMVPGTVNLTAPIFYNQLGDNSNPNAPGSFPNISVGADSVFDFDGTQAIDTPLIDLGVDASLSMWFNPDPAGTNDYVLIGYSGAGFDYVIRRSSGSFFVWVGSTFYNFGSTITNNIINGSWNFLTVTKNRGTIIVYLQNSNGSVSVSQTESAWQTADLIFDRIGARSITPINLAFEGEISNVQAWDVTLSSSDVDTLYNSGQPLMTGTQPQEANLQAWYKLNQSANFTPGDIQRPWTMTLTGSPDYASGNGAFVYTPAPNVNYLRWIDTGPPGTNFTNTINWFSRVIYGSGTNVQVQANGVYQGSTSTAGLQFYYKADGGPWTFIQEVTTTLSSTQPWSITSPNISFSESIQIQIKGQGGQYTNSFATLYQLDITGGIYTTDFSGQASPARGYTNNAYNPPPEETYVEPVWQIPDNRSAYPQSFDFDGNNDFIDLGTTTDYDTGDLSVSVWVKASSSRTTTAYIVSNSGSTSYAGFDIALKTNDQIRLRRNTRTQINDPGWVTIGFTDDVWQHLAFTYNESSNTLKLFLNGELKNTTTGTSQSVGASRLLTIGSYIGVQSFLLGQISNPQIWNTTLSDTQVETLYNNGVPLTTAIATDNLKGWWKLDNTEFYDTFNTTNKWMINNNGLSTDFSKCFWMNPLGIQVPQTLGYQDGTNAFSGAAWVNISSGHPYIISRQRGRVSSTGAYPGWSFRTIGSGAAQGDPYFEFYTNGNGSMRIKSLSYTLQDGLWHFVAFTYDGSQDVSGVKLYVDGYEDTNRQVLSNGITGTLPDFNTPFMIGGTYNQGFSGTARSGSDQFMSNAMYFESELSASDILTLYNNGTPLNDLSSFTTLKGWWKLDDTAVYGTEWTVPDASGNGNDGTSDTTMPTSNRVDFKVAYSNGASSGMTEQNLVNNNVSVLNGESEGMNSTNLVTSNIIRTQPYSNYSFNFDRAQADFFDLGTDSSMDVFSNDFSCSVWFNHTDASGGANAILEFSTFTQKFGMQLGFTSNTGVSFSFGPNPSQPWSYNGGSGYNDGNWHNFIVTKNGSSLKGYVDGVELTFSTGSITLGAFNAIGKGRNTPTYFNGKLSNCCLFDRSLTEQEILKIYNNGLTQDLQATSSFSNNIAAWWPMDDRSSYYDGTDWVIRDLENGNDGDGNNTGNVDDLVGNAPGSEASGSGNNLAIGDLKGNMSSSDKNAYSINMADYADGVTNPANSGRSTDVP